MNTIALLATTQAAPPSIADTLPYLIGMLLVLVTLTTLWGICVIIAKIIQLFAPAAAPAALATPAAPAASEPAATSPAASDQVPPQIVAVIAAAVASVAGRSHRVVSIKPSKTNWEKAGRQSILTSHRIR